ncbi:MAG: hypothetical protein V7K46_08665 [Nostoc sp.]
METFSQPILLSTLQEEFSSEELMVVKPENRLSMMPIHQAVDFEDFGDENLLNARSK